MENDVQIFDNYVQIVDYNVQIRDMSPPRETVSTYVMHAVSIRDMLTLRERAWSFTDVMTRVM